MLLRVVLGSLCVASAVHAQSTPVHHDAQRVEGSAGPEVPASDDDDDAAAEPHALDTTSLSDDLIGAPGLRPIAGSRVEALLSTGSYGTQRGLARGTTRHGALGLELDGGFLDSDGYVPIAAGDRGDIDGRAAHSLREAGARIDHGRGGSHARAFSRYSDEQRESGTAFQSASARTARYGGRWTLTGSAAHLDLQAFGEQQRINEERPLVSSDRSAASLASRHTIPLSTHGVRGSLKSRHVRALGADHELVIGGGLVLATGEQADDLSPSLDMPQHMPMVSRRIRGDHRFLDAYIEDTVRFIRTLDVSGGLIIQRWSNLGGDNSITYGLGEPMDHDIPPVTEMLLSPSLGAVQRINDDIAIRARTSRSLRAPTGDELYRPILIGDTLTAANHQLRPETVWTTEVGPEITAGRLNARAAMFYSTVDRAISSVTLGTPAPDGALRTRDNIGSARVIGVDSEASWRPSRAVLATVSYTFASSIVTESMHYQRLVGKALPEAPRHRAGAVLTYDAPRLATLTGGLRYVHASYADDLDTRRPTGTSGTSRYTLVDALAARKLTGGLTGFVGVDNLLDRRPVASRSGIDTLGAPRMFHVGLRVDSDRF